MIRRLPAIGERLRLFTDRLLSRFGMGQDAFLLVASILIGVAAAIAAVGFHELIVLIRELLYKRGGPDFLYGPGIWLLIAIPAGGGLIVSLLVRFVFREREGHGMVDVIESVLRTGGIIPPSSSIEKILTSAVTIGTGGSAGAEGPIVQIGAALASGIGQLFRVSRAQMPVLIGCGSAAGISAIFNSPIGGLLFTLEVILKDFSIRTLTPVVIASVIANFTTRAIFHSWLGQDWDAIFTMPRNMTTGAWTLGHVGNVIALGITCGLAGVSLTVLMQKTEHFFGWLKLPRWTKPALGGAALGAIGIIYVLLFRIVMQRSKFIPFQQYSMPAFFGDGYGAVQPMLGPAFYQQAALWILLLALVFLTIAKIVGTCLTLGSGGAGGIIAPSLFIGATAGGALGLLLQAIGLSSLLTPNAYATIGMGAVLAAVVHAPLAAVLILVDVTHDYQSILPAMLACITATGVARLVFRDSIYTLSLRMRGVHVGTSADLLLLRRMTIEQVPLEPAITVHPGDPVQRLLDLSLNDDATDFVVVNGGGQYAGLVVADDIRRTLIDREAVPLLLVGEIMRSDLPVLRNVDDLASVLDKFAAHDVSRLPVGLPGNANRVIGLVSRAALMRRYQQALART
jgi:CIC family chloride channel protein